MELTKDQVRHIAKLCRLQLTDSEVEKFAKQLSDVFEYMEVLSEVDTEKVEPTAQVTGLKNVKQKDEVVDEGIAKELLTNTVLPVERNQIKVKKVIE